MAGEQSTSSVGYEKIYDMGTGLIIAKVQIDKLREQDINARIMKKEMQETSLRRTSRTAVSLRACPSWQRRMASLRLCPATTASRAHGPPA